MQLATPFFQAQLASSFPIMHHLSLIALELASPCLKDDGRAPSRPTSSNVTGIGGRFINFVAPRRATPGRAL